ncbi:MAG: hypothetical protein H7A43_07000 [Verrucomicrobia bacterium]|nr:hypothetical protein [Kiritimatiellia bacterium]MCB1101389.1 hypothetical protein [Kiritimatiellia bacterium]MCP5488381.1 hypothetical protein [Verrucomicrobiota bacterium]
MIRKIHGLSCLVLAVIILGSGCATTAKKATQKVAKKSVEATVEGAKVTGKVAAKGAKAVGGAAAGAVGAVVDRE